MGAESERGVKEDVRSEDLPVDLYTPAWLTSISQALTLQSHTFVFFKY